jgi:hypothetical protein
MLCHPRAGGDRTVEPGQDKSVCSPRSVSSASDCRTDFREDLRLVHVNDRDENSDSTQYGIVNTGADPETFSPPARRLAARLAGMATDPFAMYISANDIKEIAEVASAAFGRGTGVAVKIYIESHAEFTNPIHRGLLIGLFATIECNPAAPFVQDAGNAEDIAASVMSVQRGRWWLWLLSVTKFMPGGTRSHPLLWRESADAAALLNVAATLALKSHNGHIPTYMVRAATRKFAAALEPHYGIEMHEFLVSRVAGYNVDGFRANIGEHVGMFLFMLMDAATDAAMAQPTQPSLGADPICCSTARLLRLQRSINMMTYAIHCIPNGATGSARQPARVKHSPTSKHKPKPEPRSPRSASCEVS